MKLSKAEHAAIESLLSVVKSDGCRACAEGDTEDHHHFHATVDRDYLIAFTVRAHKAAIMQLLKKISEARV